jgi:hypothetical protein
MRKLIIIVLGLVIGAALGLTLVALLTPAGEDLVTNVKSKVAKGMEDAREASAERRAELETELARARGQQSEAESSKLSTL